MAPQRKAHLRRGQQHENEEQAGEGDHVAGLEGGLDPAGKCNEQGGAGGGFGWRWGVVVAVAEWCERRVVRYGVGSSCLGFGGCIANKKSTNQPIKQTPPYLTN